MRAAGESEKEHLNLRQGESGVLAKLDDQQALHDLCIIAPSPHVQMWLRVEGREGVKEIVAASSFASVIARYSTATITPRYVSSTLPVDLMRMVQGQCDLIVALFA